MSYFAYVIKSVHFDYFYKGHCEDLEKRIKEHNAGKTKSNKAYLPFIIFYYEEFKPGTKQLKKKNFLNLLQEGDI